MPHSHSAHNQPTDTVYDQSKLSAHRVERRPGFRVSYTSQSLPAVERPEWAPWEARGHCSALPVLHSHCEERQYSFLDRGWPPEYPGHSETENGMERKWEEHPALVATHNIQHIFTLEEDIHVVYR